MVVTADQDLERVDALAVENYRERY